MLKKQTVFIISLIVLLAVILGGAVFPDFMRYVVPIVHEYVLGSFGWLYLLAAFFFLVFSIILAFSRFGSIKLGGDNEKPQYSYFGWLSMLFAAGMGIGLIFWGVAEPLSHYLHPVEHIPAISGEAAGFAMRYSFLHWGLQPWGIYIVMSLSLAYFTFRRGMPPLISSCFYPLLGEKIYGGWGYLIDILAVVSTIFGVATSLGLGAKQIHGGLNFLYGIPDTIQITIIIIVIATVLFMLSSIIGLDKGIQFLSKSNMAVAGVLLLLVLILGPTSHILAVFSSTMGDYLNNILHMSLQANPFEGYEWTKSWTLFYWAWWISWSPFVGVFISRISRGRTIKEFIGGALIVPTLLTFFWFSVFGGTALHMQIHEGIEIASLAYQEPELALFAMLDYLPLGELLSLLSVILLAVFFVTSADSATFVLGMMTSRGSLTPPLSKKLTWGVIQSAVAIVLLFTGGLTALQEMNISAALPFSVVMILLCYNLYAALREEPT